jgi:hypothetical protein
MNRHLQVQRLIETALRLALTAIVAGLTIMNASEVQAQTFPSDDPVIRQMWEVGMENSQTEALAQVLMDSVGPRLAGSPGLDAAVDWLERKYQSWGIRVRKEQYGTWRGWRQGPLHVDLVAPRIQTLEAELLAWSPGTDGPVEGGVIALPEVAASGESSEWLPMVSGKFVLISVPESTCRAPQQMEELARPETVERLDSLRNETRRAWYLRLRELGGSRSLARQAEEAGALGVISSEWSRGWGVNKIFSAYSEGVVSIDLSCEDYGLVYRLAAKDQGPKLRIEADAEELGEVPQFNVIAELRGDELPDEYIVLSAHLDSWHGATGATDNGTGTITMLEAMRILKQTYPNPRRTILVGHWGVEEMGLIGSRAFTEDHPEVIEGLQVAFNQDNGTWRAERIEGQGFLHAGEHIGRWISLVPSQISEHITLEFPGAQNNRGSDHSSFLCHGAPAFRLQSHYDEYRQYTWHTNRDTYDKIVFDDLKENATLAAMLAYAASEDPDRLPRDKAVLPVDPRTGEPREWPQCRPARRSSGR